MPFYMLNCTKETFVVAHDIHKQYSFNQSIADEFAAQERDNMEVGKLKILQPCIYIYLS